MKFVDSTGTEICPIHRGALTDDKCAERGCSYYSVNAAIVARTSPATVEAEHE